MMSNRLTYINNEGELDKNAPKGIQTAYDAFMASVSGQQLARRFLFFKAAGNTVEAQLIIDNANAGLDLVSADESGLPCRIDAAMSVSPRRER
jgi:hypothetical protein